jgi:hypothetical protein
MKPSRPNAPNVTAVLRAVCLALAACHGSQAEVEAPAVVDTPAVVVHPTPEGHAAIEQAVYVVLQRPVTVADDALTSDGVLIVERTWVSDPSGHPANGRELGAGTPERFHLVLSGDRCILVHDRTNRRAALVGAQCAPR